MRLTKYLSLATLVLLCNACAPMGSSSDLERRVDEQDIQLRQMQPQQADTWNEVQALRQEVAQLKGQLADLNNAGGAKELADRVRQHDQALREVDSNMALNLPLGSPMQTAANRGMPIAQGASESAAGIVPRPGNAPESSAYAAAPAAAAPAAAAVATATPPQTGNYGLPPDPAPQPVTAPGESTWGKEDPKPDVPAATNTPAAKKDLALALLEAGQNDLKARNYKAAQRSFNDFLKNYPKHAKAADAQYYLGESYFASNNFPQAALAFDDVLRKYPKSSLLPAAYLKEGISFSKMGKPDAARMRLNELIKKFPNSAEAKRAQAFLKTNK